MHLIRYLRSKLRIGEPLDRLRACGNEVGMARMKRGVGYCMNKGSGNDSEGCEDYAKGVFLLNHGDRFSCPRCRIYGVVVKEKGFADDPDGIFKEVRVEYNYDPIEVRYREVAIVRDDAIWGPSSTYTLMSPLIKTEKRALKVAESILANLQRYSGLLLNDDIPRTTEIILSWDEDLPEFKRKLKKLSDDWQRSALVSGQKPPSDDKELPDL